MSDTIATVDADTGRLVPPVKPDAWLIVFGDRSQFRDAEIDEAVARKVATAIGGQALPLALMQRPMSSGPVIEDSKGSGLAD